MPEPEENVATPPTFQRASVTLSVYDWHLLLKAMENLICIVNRDNANVKRIYEVISTQLCEVPVKVQDD